MPMPMRDQSLPPVPPHIAQSPAMQMAQVRAGGGAPAQAHTPQAAVASPADATGLGYARELLVGENGVASQLSKVARILAADRRDLLPYVQKMVTMGAMLTKELETSMSQGQQGAQGPEALAPTQGNNSGAEGGGAVSMS